MYGHIVWQHHSDANASGGGHSVEIFGEDTEKFIERELRTTRSKLEHKSSQ